MFPKVPRYKNSDTHSVRVPQVMEFVSDFFLSQLRLNSWIKISPVWWKKWNPGLGGVWLGPLQDHPTRRVPGTLVIKVVITAGSTL